jgi:GNAT superfamily N-acetyltransferase
MSDDGWIRLADDPTLADALASVEADGAAFLEQLTAEHRRHVTATYPQHQWLRCRDGRVEAVVRAVPLVWDGTTAGAPTAGVGGALHHAHEGGNTLAVLDVAVAPERRGAGLGSAVLRELDDLRERAGRSRLLVLVRPHAKRHHPLVPFGRYVAATDGEGRPCDGWLAAAWEAGLHPVLAVDRSLVARAPVAAWEAWYGRPFPTSGPYLLPGAIKPAIVEHERDEGRYREPHLWMAPAGQLAQRTVDPEALREPRDAWRRALASVGLVPGSRRHRQVRRAVD